MWRLFITLYALIIATVIGGDFIADKYFDAFHSDMLTEDQSRDTRTLLVALEHFTEHASTDELKDVLAEGNISSNLPIEVLEMVEFERLYPQAISQFNKYNTFFINNEDYEFLYRMQNREAVLKIGPIITIQSLDELDALLELAVWLLLAIVISFWQINLWRKLVSLERQVVAFGEGNLSARASEAPGGRVGKLNTVFNSMAEKTSQLLLQNKQLIRAVSHELRAPISRLRCQLDLIDTESNRMQNAAYLDDMSGEITELENLVDEILNYSRLEASDNIVVNIKEQKIQPILQDALNTINLEFFGNISLRCDPYACAKIDELHFRRAIGNLLQNAVRYCAHLVEVSVEVDPVNALIYVNVDDDGPGIPKHDRIRIFEPFARLDQSRTRQSGGYGLGLSIVTQIAHLHDGEVRITTSPLNGSRFTLILPACC